ncbi:MAG: GNAT family N-acetyltransferase [Candidatus Krumholzibacteria bacterium]|nr:GNAT family N-acetyltransferase [Candidatus Krumholzibacteria bacterium]
MENRPQAPPLIRSFRPEDAPGVVSVIRSVYGAVGFAMDFDEFDRDLADICAHYQDAGGGFWVLDEGGLVTGCVGATPAGAEGCELHRLYLLDSRRGKGWGRRLLETALEWCRENGRPRVFLWSGIRFERARDLYVKCGFVPTQRTRAIDPVNPHCTERLFELAR